MRSLVIGASGGIGAAMVRCLSEKGEATGLSRSADGLDVTDEASVGNHLGALEGTFDVIFVATGGLGRPEKMLKAIGTDALDAQFRLNAVGPILVLKHALRLMPRDRRVVFAALSARVGSIGDNGLGGWYSYRASKAALNQLLHTASIEVARTHKHSVVVALHPGTVATPFTAGYGHQKVTPDQAAANLVGVMGALTPDQTGGFFDYAGKKIAW